MAIQEIVIQNNVPLPKREGNFGPRKPGKIHEALSKMGINSFFALKIEGKYDQVTNKGEHLTVEQDQMRKVRQRQSYLSSLAKKLNISIATRWNFDPDNYADCLGVWRVEPKSEETEEGEDEETEEGEDEETEEEEEDLLDE